MRIKLAVLADFANVTREGKLNIIGLFDTIAVRTLPAVHPQLQLVFRLEANYAERDRQQTIEVVLDDPDGRRLLSMQGQFVVTGREPGRMSVSDQILTFGNLSFEREGGYTFHFFINDNLDPTSVVLEVVRVPEEEQPRLLGT